MSHYAPPQQLRVVKRGSKVCGFFDPVKCNISLLEGCNYNVLVEVLWHATSCFAKTNAPKLYIKMLECAFYAPQSIKDVVGDIYPELDVNSAIWMEKVGAMLFVREHSDKIVEFITSHKRQVRMGLKSVFVDAWRTALRKVGAYKVDIDRLAELPPKEVMAGLAEAFILGKRLGDLKPLF